MNNITNCEHSLINHTLDPQHWVYCDQQHTESGSEDSGNYSVLPTGIFGRSDEIVCSHHMTVQHLQNIINCAEFNKLSEFEVYSKPLATGSVESTPFMCVNQKLYKIAVTEDFAPFNSEILFHSQFLSYRSTSFSQNKCLKHSNHP